MSGYIDLHLHTTRSDGVLTPLELLEAVRSKKLEAFSITDHDSLKGYLEVCRSLNDNDPELLTGVELSTSKEDNDLHLLVYCFDPEHKRLCEALEDLRERRNQRAARIVSKLNELGKAISMNQIESIASGAAVGRPHIAQALLNNKMVQSFDEAFSRFIGRGKIAYIPKVNFEPEEAIKLGHEAGGVVIMAHPMLDKNDRYIEELVGAGLDGIEAYHPYHRPAQRNRLIETARRLGLLVSGGSDYHGREGRFGDIGSQKVPRECLTEIKNRSRYMRDMT
ncbi:MAG: PHP domain-containing protein [bacterium]|nr:PHP domain-containing protein [bacterium]